MAGHLAIIMSYRAAGYSSRHSSRFPMNVCSVGRIIAEKVFTSAAYLLQGKVHFYGIKVVKIYVREVTATYGSHAYFYAPNWKEEYSKRVITGTDGDDGKHGIDGTEGL